VETTSTTTVVDTKMTTTATTISAEQHYVHPKPPAWPPFAFHLLDEILALF
jgi:hypothetical protein